MPIDDTNLTMTAAQRRALTRLWETRKNRALSFDDFMNGATTHSGGEVVVSWWTVAVLVRLSGKCGPAYEAHRARYEALEATHLDVAR